MKINIGSKNPVKVAALREMTLQYDLLKGAEIVECDAKTGVSEQPKSLDETVEGAMNRAKGAFFMCDYSVGLESGLMKVPHTKSGYMDLCACAIYDGKEFHLGLSSAFEYPLEVTRMLHEEGITASEAYFRAGLSKHRNIGSLDGAIGLLTKGRVTRKDYTKQAIQMALVHLENPSLYKKR